MTLVEATLDARFTCEVPDCIVADKAYDSDELDKRLEEHWGIELIAPNKTNRTHGPKQDRRKLRRYRGRWKIERLFAWIFSFRRTAVRYEYHAANYLGFLHLSCILILFRYL